MKMKSKTRTNADKRYRSAIAGAVHEMMSGGHDAGVVSRATMRSFDAACLAPAPVLGGDEIRAIREREQVSQPVFAAYLNVSRNLVSDWERGVKRPGGPALRLLSIIQRKGLRAVA
jgi:putative transcriptional regulator